MEKWDLYVDSFELATGYSELVDPVIQRERLEAWARLGADGDAEAMPWMRISSLRSSTACRHPPASAWESTDCSWR